jgi:hypothetical protein
VSTKKRVVMPLPNVDFDPTEVCVSWEYLHSAGYEVVFATENGDRAYADPIMVSGEGLDPWGFIPGLKNSFFSVGYYERAKVRARPI